MQCNEFNVMKINALLWKLIQCNEMIAIWCDESEFNIMNTILTWSNNTGDEYNVMNGMY